MKKKILGIVLALGLMCSFTACGSSNDAATATTAATTVATTAATEAVAEATTEATTTTTEATTTTTEATTTTTEAAAEIKLRLNVLYNDSDSNYYSTEVSSDEVTVTENGQYELTFDCATDLTDNAKTAGVRNLQHLTAIFVYDQAVRDGSEAASPLKTADIRWDKVVVDGVELAVTNSDFKSALKSNGIFDTNDPINSWDGSAVEGMVEAGEHVLDFADNENPQKITVTFTIDNLEFK
ncbi:MAG TPA: hypothetical protein DCQ46_06590 [Lachnospiraceae bacterium]|nr:hypothetical protein [Lachnospiraceae bacterium]HBR04134.1 hypothetical protein [Lachnospiraceae bacterium]